ncbi:unnamed protein product [Notodromas monacha]|uniref:Uncharacterized protein n=1 Tax=Notodromas monacha TaxID=399045 RepID=A0A7R9BPH4_9CRUS|nr:unnamed protein product [Notodromas monacha]CAG0919023.1 unnamed protein product [Notodromas monacha]
MAPSVEKGPDSVIVLQPKHIIHHASSKARVVGTKNSPSKNSDNRNMCCRVLAEIVKVVLIFATMSLCFVGCSEVARRVLMAVYSVDTRPWEDSVILKHLNTLKRDEEKQNITQRAETINDTENQHLARAGYNESVLTNGKEGFFLRKQDGQAKKLPPNWLTIHETVVHENVTEKKRSQENSIQTTEHFAGGNDSFSKASSAPIANGTPLSTDDLAVIPHTTKEDLAKKIEPKKMDKSSPSHQQQPTELPSVDLTIPSRGRVRRHVGQIKHQEAGGMVDDALALDEFDWETPEEQLPKGRKAKDANGWLDDDYDQQGEEEVPTTGYQRLCAGGSCSTPIIPSMIDKEISSSEPAIQDGVHLGSWKTLFPETD